jgi:probable HAF family extracellular repeat protein
MAPTFLRAMRHAWRILPAAVLVITAACSDDVPTSPAVQPRAAATGLDIVSAVALEGFLDAEVNLSEARDVNDLRMVVGYSSHGQGIRAALWDNSQFATELPTLGGGSIAEGISMDGAVIVGGSGVVQGDGSEKWSAVRWLKPAGSWVVDALPNPLGATSCGARDVSDDGTTIGGVCRIADSDHAVVWQNGVARDLGAGYLNGVNNTTATGVTHTPQQTPVTWDLTVGTPTATPIGSLGGLSGNAKGIDALGTVVGVSQNATSDERPFMYTAKKGMIELPMLPNTNFAIANAVEGDRIVGMSHFGSSSSHATLWQKGKVVNLGALPGYISAAAWAVTPGGLVAGYSSPDYGPYRATLWTLK